MSSPDNSHYPALVKALEDAFKLAGDAVKLLVDNCNRGVDNINNTPLIYLTPDFISGLGDALNELRDYVDKFVKAMQEFMNHQAPMIALIRAAFDWLTEVQRPVSDMAGRAPVPVDPNLRTWTGSASSHYQSDVVGPQSKALSQAHPKADAISKWLIQVAQANIEFLTKYAEKIGEIASTAVAALISAGTIVGALEAIGKGAELCGYLIKSAVTVFTDSVKYYSGAIGFMRDATSIRNNVEAYPGSAWPQAVR